jgi:hypothetical protein
MNTERIAMLCDELLRHGVPREVVQGVVDWMDAQSPPWSPRHRHVWHEGRCVCGAAK